MVINRRTFSAALIAGAAASLASTRGMDLVRALISGDDRTHRLMLVLPSCRAVGEW